jgi:hypothetical protein
MLCGLVGRYQCYRALFVKLGYVEPWWSTAVHRCFQRKEHCKNFIKHWINTWMKILPHMSGLILGLLVDFQQKIGELVLSITSCPTTITLEDVLHLCLVLCMVYGNLNHCRNVSRVHLHALFGVGNFTNMVCVCSKRLWSGLRLLKVLKTLF